MPVYSHSQLSAYEQCPLKYKFNYIDRIKRDTKGIEAFVGSMVHDTLQKCYDDARQAKVDTLDELLAYYQDQWQKNWNDSIIIVKREYSADDYRNRGADMIAKYYHRCAPFDSDITIATEMPVFLSLKDGRYKLRGFIDRLSRSGDIYRIHDYKTSSYLPSQSDADSDRQLALYQIGIAQKWPHMKNVDLIWHYLAFDEDIQSNRSQQSISTLIDDTTALIDKIEAEEEFAPCESTLCNWCEYQDLCPLRKHFVKVDELPPSQYLSETGVSLVNKYVDLKEKESDIKQQVEEIKQAIISYARENGLELVKGSDHKIRVKIENRLKFPGKSDAARTSLDELIKEAGIWDDLSHLDTAALNGVLKSGDIDNTLKQKIMDLVTVEESRAVYLSRLKEQEK